MKFPGQRKSNTTFQWIVVIPHLPERGACGRGKACGRIDQTLVDIERTLIWHFSSVTA